MTRFDEMLARAKVIGKEGLTEEDIAAFMQEIPQVDGVSGAAILRVIKNPITGTVLFSVFDSSKPNEDKTISLYKRIAVEIDPKDYDAFAALIENLAFRDSIVSE